MKKNIIILGAGPRGLATALQLQLVKNMNIYLIDAYPISTWLQPNMLNNMLMRSPISFDLTTLCPSLYNYSLSKHLGCNHTFNNQEEVEKCNILCTRKEFIDYLNYIIRFLKKQSNISFIQKNITSINEDYVTCTDVNYNYDYLIICSGRYTHCIDIPNYLRNKTLLSIKDIIESNYTKEYLNVLGSGQQAAEIVEYASKQNKVHVNWLQKHEPIIKQYPVPSLKEWGYLSALGNYYSKLCNPIEKEEYLKRVKRWGPSITPSIALDLQSTNYSIVNPSNTNDINMDADFILANGFKQKISYLPFNFDIALDRLNNNYPNILKDFQSSSHPYIYFNGLLSLRYDGPRQGSIISAAQTVETITNSILSN